MPTVINASCLNLLFFAYLHLSFVHFACLTDYPANTARDSCDLRRTAVRTVVSMGLSTNQPRIFHFLQGIWQIGHAFSSVIFQPRLPEVGNLDGEPW